MTVLITGGTGFLGRHLGVKLKELGLRPWLGGRNNKQNQYASQVTGLPSIPLDVSNMESVRDVVNKVRPEVIIHAAATKFVDLSEKYPLECMDINVVGSMNVARVAIDKGIKSVIGVSTDKASPPIANIYGLSKSTMEKMFTSLNGSTKFSCVRYGNVVWSTGSIFPLWEKMSEKGIVYTTGPRMRRFFFSIDDAVSLVIKCLDSIEYCQGKVLSKKMKSAQISDILNVWIKHYGGIWTESEGRPGDREDEYLIGKEEVFFTEAIDDHYLIHKEKIIDRSITEPFSSLNAKDFLIQNTKTYYRKTKVCVIS